MLVNFHVKNFRSFKDEQELNLVATTDKLHKDTNTIDTGVNATPSLLKSAVIYGPNASGKSNLIKALQYMRGVIAESASIKQPFQSFTVQPFRLDNESSDQPTQFEITFIIDGIRYQYGFEMTTQRITSEFLLVYKSFKPQMWFQRSYDSKIDEDQYQFGPSFKGKKSLWQAATRPNSLFLSMAIQLNSNQLEPIFNWFINNLIIMNEITPLDEDFTVQMLKKSDGKKAIIDFLSSADMCISDIDVISKKVPSQTVRFDMLRGKTEYGNDEMEQNEIIFHHITGNGKANFGLPDESSGTRNLLFLTGPVLDILDKGLTLVVDELDTSLHPLLVRQLVQLFHNPELNSRGAQLLFSTHDTSLLDSGVFRRDQIWFVEKDTNQASKLYALVEFSPRKNEALERGYLMGRYGALPFFEQEGGLLHGT